MKQTILFEIGVEELPARFIHAAEKQLFDQTKDWFTDMRISYENLQTFSTPRRLSVRIEEVESRQTTIQEEVRGPALSIAKKDGEWTKAAIGFTKGQGKTVDDIYTKDVKDTTYVFVEKVTEGKETKELLPSFKEVITSLTFPQQMYWGSKSFSFARPIRWLVALYGSEIIPFSIAGVHTSNQTKGHRFLGEDVTLSAPADYEKLLEENYVLVEPEKRSNRIIEGIRALEKEHGFEVIIADALLDEVTNLVEYPTAFAGTYEEEFLNLPSEVLITSMQEHQRYFPVQKEGKLIPYFIGVRNGDDYCLDNVVAGNEKVLHARLSDGEFFYEEDQNKTIDTYNEQLKSIVFHDRLGTVHDKVERVQKIAKEIASKLGVQEPTMQDIERTASICKFDLPTLMVNEFPELQGVMGEKYARLAREKDAVAIGIREHYLPLYASGELPTTDVGAIVSVADKLDTIVACISVGLIPTGSRDPYGLRRQAIGALRTIHANDWSIPIETFVQIARTTVEAQGIEMTTTVSDVREFIRMRASYVMRELGITQDIIESVLSKGLGVFSYELEKANELLNMRNDRSYTEAQEAFTRVLNIEKQAESSTIQTELFETDSERSLYDWYIEIRDKFKDADAGFKARKALEALAELAAPIEEFFDHNMVMTDDERIRNNRLALLSALAKLIRSFADMDKIEWKQTF